VPSFNSLSPEILFPAAKILIVGAFGISIIRSFRESDELTPAFESFAVGFFALLFFREGLSWLSNTGKELSEFIAHQGDSQSLREMVLSALAATEKAPLPGGEKTLLNIPSLVEQAWRLGVFGIMSQIVDFFFLLSSFLIETARSVFWQILLFLFPLGCGVYPIFPGILRNLSVYAVELSLWDGVLKMIQITTATAAKSYLTQDGSLGLPMVGVELIAIILTLSVPSITHRIVSGTLQHDFSGTSRSALQLSRNWIHRVKGGIRTWAG